MKLNCVCYVFRLCFTKGHFPKLAECAHFHYENVDFGTIQVKSSKLLLLPSKSKHTYPKWWRIQAVGWTDCPQSSVFAFKMLMGSCCMRLQHRGCQSLSRRSFKLWKRLFARVIPPWCWVRNGKMMFIKTQSMTHVSLQIDVKLNSCVFFPAIMKMAGDLHLFDIFFSSRRFSTTSFTPTAHTSAHCYSSL